MWTFCNTFFLIYLLFHICSHIEKVQIFYLLGDSWVRYLFHQINLLIQFKRRLNYKKLGNPSEGYSSSIISIRCKPLELRSKFIRMRIGFES